jgi:hypothetical protein
MAMWSYPHTFAKGQAIMDKTCKRCNTLKPLTEFYKDKASPDGRFLWCKECSKAYQKSWLGRNNERRQRYWDTARERMRRRYQTDEAHRERVKQRVREWRAKVGPQKIAEIQRKQRLHREYDLTQEQYEEMAALQGHRCAVCHKKKKLMIDHDHETKLVRGLLCSSCNRAIGALGDRLDLVYRAIGYLKRHERYTAIEEGVKPNGS